MDVFLFFISNEERGEQGEKEELGIDEVEDEGRKC
jgi:hypothetical protein